MAKRGRKSVAKFNIVALVPSTRHRLSPPTMLTKPERVLFGEVVAENGHLRLADVKLLAGYVQALAKTYRFARKSDGASHKAWVESGRLALAYARALRLTTISQMHRETAGRANANASPVSYYDRMDNDDD